MELILLLTWDPVGNVCTRHKSTQGETVCKVTNTNRPTTFRSHKSIQLGLVWHRVYEKCIWTIILVACLASEWPLYGTKHAHCALAMCKYAFFVQICATTMIFKKYCRGAVSVLVWWWWMQTHGGSSWSNLVLNGNTFLTTMPPSFPTMYIYLHIDVQEIKLPQIQTIYVHYKSFTVYEQSYTHQYMKTNLRL